MKIAIAQLNYHIGNFKNNLAKIKLHIEQGRMDGADLIVFSELAICGYASQDLFEREDFILECENATKEVIDYTKNIAIIIGTPTLNKTQKGKMLYNSALFIQNKKIEFIQHKTLLPTYNIFDEYRYFEPNTLFDILSFKGKKIGITICEDIWEKQYDGNNFINNTYSIYPVEELKKQGADFIINISASPFSIFKNEIRKKIIADCSLKYNLPLLYVNQVGASTEIIFDGVSKIANSKGEIIDELASFEEDFKIVEIGELENKKEIKTIDNDKIELMHHALILGIQDYFRKSGIDKAIIGLSGGIDSAVTLSLAVNALGNENVKTMFMPSPFTSILSTDGANQLAQNLNIEHEILSINSMMQHFDDMLHPFFKETKKDTTEENIQARIRGILLMALSNKFGAILLNTSNKSEIAVGYSTLYGDMNGGLSILGDVYKTNVYKLAKYINRNNEIIPYSIITAPPSAELKPDQLDEDSLPDYPTLDKILYQYLEMQLSADEIINAGKNEDTVKKVIRLVQQNEYKRFQSPPILRVTTKSFGRGRKIPLIAKYS